MAEKDMRRKVIKELRSLHAVAIENLTSAGMPDVHTVCGFIELKYKASWPVRESTPVRVDHFTEIQRRWLTLEEKCGGRAWLLLQCGREWMLFGGLTAATYVGRVPRTRLEELAVWYSKDGFKKEELIGALCSDH